MGGDGESIIASSEDESFLKQEFPEISLGLPTVSRNDCSIGNSLDFEVDRRRIRNVYMEVFSSYSELRRRSEDLEEAKSKILSYLPGAWTEKVGGMELSDFNVPKTTTLLLIGPENSGKSSLINKISRVFDNDKFASDRAQVSYNSTVGGGTYFLQEYMIPRGSTSFCLCDTRGLSDNPSENMEMLKRWMREGICHGELIIRDSDSSNLKRRMKCKAQKGGYRCSEMRMVNFVILVVNGISILKSMDSDDGAEKRYTNMISTTFNHPFLSFRDDKPVIVVTHGDLLSLSDRARVRVHLGELLGVPPTKQIFDIPESRHRTTDLAIVNMLRYSLEHADRNLSSKERSLSKVATVILLQNLLFLIILGIVLTAAHIYIHRITNHAQKDEAPPVKARVDWHSIRHLWYG